MLMIHAALMMGGPWHAHILHAFITATTPHLLCNTVIHLHWHDFWSCVFDVKKDYVLFTLNNKMDK